MASPTRWTWVWVNSGSWWWTGRPGVLRFMGSQRIGHDWATELNWTEHAFSRIDTILKRGQEIRIYSLNFPMYHTIVLVLFLALYIISLVPIYFITRCLYLFDHLPPISHPSPPNSVSGNYKSDFLSRGLFSYLFFEISCVSEILQYLSFSVWHFISYNAFRRRRRWHPTPVLLPGKSHGRRSLVGCSPGGR